MHSSVYHPSCCDSPASRVKHEVAIAALDYLHAAVFLGTVVQPPTLTAVSGQATRAPRKRRVEFLWLAFPLVPGTSTFGTNCQHMDSPEKQLYEGQRAYAKGKGTGGMCRDRLVLMEDDFDSMTLPS